MTDHDHPEDRRVRDERLERLLDRAAREQPSRRAPPTLEGRVLREIVRRSRSSPRQSGFTRWPLAVRAALVAGCCACAALVMLAADPLIVRWMEELRDAREALSAVGALVGRLVGAIPTDWLLGGLLATALLYALLFALLAVGCSMLGIAPERARSTPT